MSRLFVIFLVLVPFLPVLAGAPVVTVDADKAPQLDADCHNYPAIVKVASTGQEYWCNPSLGPNGKWRPVNEAPCCCGRDEHGSCSGCSPAQECYQGGHICVSQNSLWICADPDGDGVLRYHTIDSQGNMRWEDGYDLDHDYAVDQAEGLKSTNIPVDVDADGTADWWMRSGTRGDLGVTSPCWDLWGPDTDLDGDPDPDGTCELFFDPSRGIVTAAGKPYIVEPVALFTTSDDVHGEIACCDCSDGFDQDDVNCSYMSRYHTDLAWAVMEAAKHGIPVGWPVMQDTDCEQYDSSNCPGECMLYDSDGDGTKEACGYGPREEVLRFMVEHGMVVGTHTGTHCGISPDTALLAGWGNYAVGYNPTNRAMYAKGGTAHIKEGDNWLYADPSSGADFDRHCFAPDRYGVPHGSSVAIDCDKDGQMDFESWVVEIDEDGDRIRLHDALPADCDGDGTTGETITGLTLNDDSDRDWFINSFNVEIRGSWRHGKFAYRDMRENVEEKVKAIAPWMKALWGARPGGTSAGVLEEVTLAAHGLHEYEGGSFGNQSLRHATGEPDSVIVNRISINCDNQPGAIAELMDLIIEERGVGHFFGHVATDYSAGSGNTCDPTGSADWSRQQYTEFLEKCQSCMREGTCVCADPMTIERLVHLWGGARPLGKNLLGNPALKVNTKLGHAGPHSSTYPQGVWPWYSVQAALDGDSTANIYYDEQLEMTWLDPKDQGSVILYQDVRLSWGYYEIYAATRAEGIPRGADWYGAYLQVQNRNAGATGADSYAKRMMIPVRWYTSPHYEDGNGEEYDGFARHTPQDNKSWFVNGDGIEREIRGIFYVPPEMDGLWIRVGLGCSVQGEDRKNGIDDDGDGLVDEKERCAFYSPTLLRVTPENVAAQLSGGMSMVPHMSVNTQPHGWIPGTRTVDHYNPAFVWVWAPNGNADMDGDGIGDGILDHPERPIWLVFSPTTTDHDFVRVKVDGTGQAIFHGVGIADWQDTTSNILTSDNYGLLGYDGTGIYIDKDKDHLKDSDEVYLGEGGGGGGFSDTEYSIGTECDGPTSKNPYVIAGSTLTANGGQNQQQVGICWLNTDGTAGGDVMIQALFAEGSKTTTHSYGLYPYYPHMKTFSARLRVAPYDRATRSGLDIIAGLAKTGTNMDQNDVTDGVYFWCDPDGDTDEDGVSGDQDGDGTFCEAGDDDPDECNWWVKVFVNGGNYTRIATSEACFDNASARPPQLLKIVARPDDASGKKQFTFEIWRSGTKQWSTDWVDDPGATPTGQMPFGGIWGERDDTSTGGIWIDWVHIDGER